MNELWKDIEGYEGLYQVSNMGRVRSLDHVVTVTRGTLTFDVPKHGHVLTPTKRQHGYLAVMLYGNGGHATRHFKTFSVHRLVADAFLSNPHGYTEVNHIDENKQNNRSDNLEWCSRKQNINAGTVQHRRSLKIRNNAQSRAVNQYMPDGTFIRRWPSFGEIVRQTGFAKGNVYYACQHPHKIAYGYRWQYAS